MLKALMQKKLREFQANHLLGLFVLLFAISLLSFAPLLFDTPLARGVAVAPLIVAGLFLGVTCAATAFTGDFANEANRFLEYLPVRRSTVWLASYLSGLAVLGLAAVSLFWAGVLVFPFEAGTEAAKFGPSPDRLFMHLIPGRLALVVSCGSTLFWVYSVTVFPVAYLDKKDGRPNTGNTPMVLGLLLLPLAIVVILNVFAVTPSGLAISPVLLTSGVLLSAGSYALFALVPKHISRTKHALLGIGLFLVIFAALVGQLYLKHLTWRVLDASQPLRVSGVYAPPLAGEPDLVVADVFSYGSGQHHISLDIQQGTYHDLGRGMSLLDVPEDDSGLLHFLHSPYTGFGYHGHAHRHFASITPDAKRRRSFRIPSDEYTSAETARWLPDRQLLVYSAWVRASRRTCLHVAGSGGRLLKRFELGHSGFLVSAGGQVLAIAPTKTGVSEEKPYMIVDLDSGAVRRFGLPGQALIFAKDLGRVICQRRRIQAGREYKSYVVVELPSLEERSILSEDEFPPREVTSQVDVSVHASIPDSDDRRAAFLRVNDAFDAALWVKQRIEGDEFRYSIVHVDLDTGEQRVALPESAAPRMPVAVTGGSSGTPITVDRFTADQAAFTYRFGARTYLCDIRSHQSTLLADLGIPMDADEQATEMLPRGRSKYKTEYSPSGRRVLRYADVFEKQLNADGRARLKFAAVEIFESGKPVRVHTGQRQIKGALWVDGRRIVFYENEAIYLLPSAGGPPQQVFPPVGSAGSQ